MLLYITMVYIISLIFLFFYFRRKKQKIIIPSTKWRNGNLLVTVIYIDKERIYFVTKEDCVCVLSILKILFRLLLMRRNILMMSAKQAKARTREAIINQIEIKIIIASAFGQDSIKLYKPDEYVLEALKEAGYNFEIEGDKVYVHWG